MVQIATPSRERLESYIRMREEIERQVGAINGNYGRIGAPAVHYLHQSLPREDLSAFYAAADVMTVTPLRDGMNLVAKEYVAARVNGGGVLLLSEFTGAAKELKTALMVNPYDTDGVKEALRTALTMPPAEARRRMRSLRRHVLINDVDKWARRYLTALEGQPDQLTDAAGRLPDDVRVRDARRRGYHPPADRGRLRRHAGADRRRPGRRPARCRGRWRRCTRWPSVTGTEVCVISGRARALLPGAARRRRQRPAPGRQPRRRGRRRHRPGRRGHHGTDPDRPQAARRAAPVAAADRGRAPRRRTGDQADRRRGPPARRRRTASAAPSRPRSRTGRPPGPGCTCSAASRCWS